VLLALTGLVNSLRAPAARPSDPIARWNWQLTVKSALLYTLAFNLIFFIQELFLVLSKALVPGLRPTLYHNNHRWEGNDPLANLLQSSGATAILVTGIVCAFLLSRGPRGTASSRLFLIWMTYNGFLQSLPQVIVGAVVPENDVGMAMNYLHFTATAKTAAALIALALIPLVSLSLLPQFLRLAQAPAQIADMRARTRFVFLTAALPSITAIFLIIPFRVPRNWIEVVMVPLVVTAIGVAWLQSGAWLVSAKAEARPSGASVACLLGALLILLLLFQCVLRPGIRFY
jgi:hypothetical protein